MITKLLLAFLLLAVSAQLYLPEREIPGSCKWCMYNKPTKYFTSCDIYDGGNCLRYCFTLQASYWHRPNRTSHRCFKTFPSLSVLHRLYASCIEQCSNLRRKIQEYRAAGEQKVFTKSRLADKKTSNGGVIRMSKVFGYWNASRIKALTYLSVDRLGFVKSQGQVITHNPPLRCSRLKNGTETCGYEMPMLCFPQKEGDEICTRLPMYLRPCDCSRSICSVQGACPKCCKTWGYFWL